MEATDAGKTEETPNPLRESDERRIDALRLLFRNKYARQTPDLMGAKARADAAGLPEG